MSRLTDDEYENLMAAARARNARMTQTEHANGFAAPEDGPPRETIRTIATASRAAILTQDWGTAAEALVLLESYMALVYELPVGTAY